MESMESELWSIGILISFRLLDELWIAGLVRVTDSKSGDWWKMVGTAPIIGVGAISIERRVHRTLAAGFAPYELQGTVLNRGFPRLSACVSKMIGDDSKILINRTQIS